MSDTGEEHKGRSECSVKRSEGRGESVVIGRKKKEDEKFVVLTFVCSVPFYFFLLLSKASPSPVPVIFPREVALVFSASNSLMTGARNKGAVKNTATALKPAVGRKVGKRGIRKVNKEKKAKKDPNQPKRPPSAFFVFLEEFRTTFKKENPNVKAVSAVGKAAGEVWKSMSEADKAPYDAKAQKRKADYEKQMKDYNKKQETSANGAVDDEDA
ncbi:hypothetical protein V6N13_060073 [Hibiscus sabdariffa]